MHYCQECKLNVVNNQKKCPLCDHELENKIEITEKSWSPYPVVPLRFSRRTVLNLLMLSTGISGLLFLLIEALWLRQRQGVQLSVFGMLSLWAVVSIIIRKRRNIAKSVAYLYVIFSLITIYLDYATNWEAWSTTYAIPVISIFSIIAMYLSVRIVHLALEDYVMYLIIALILGMAPALFLFFDWLTSPIPTIISLGFSSFMFILVLFFHGSSIWHEWKKRMHI